eukprot:scaffold7087_cov168-Amphora_coffeaeformis.AAC.6
MSRPMCLEIGFASKASFTRRTTVRTGTVDARLTLGLASAFHPLVAGEFDAQAFGSTLGTCSDHRNFPQRDATRRNNYQKEDMGDNTSTSYMIVCE